MPEDMRHQPRFAVENPIFIELVSPEFGSHESGKIARGKTLDVSRSGLRVGLEQELPVGAILQVGVQLPASAGTLYLVSEVRWSLPVPGTGADPGWSAGLALCDADDSDIDDWWALVDALEASDQ